MCGRFYIAEDDEDELLDEMLAEAAQRQQALTGESTIARGEVLPSSFAAALAVGRSGKAGAFPMQWGFRRYDGKGLIINTRSETALQRPMFRQSMLERRCLIPASWYFEWEKKGNDRIKYAIRPESKGVMYLAGIYRFEEDKKLPVFSVLTREPSPGIAFIHDRMPVIFSAGSRDAWLDRSADPGAVLRQCEQAMRYRNLQEPCPGSAGMV